MSFPVKYVTVKINVNGSHVPMNALKPAVNISKLLKITIDISEKSIRETIRRKNKAV